VNCHSADGTGRAARGRLPRIPDFTGASWQGRQSDAQLLASILDGKGTEMPPWRGKMSKAQARGLVAYVRSFAPNAKRLEQQKQTETDPGGFEEQFIRLQKELDESRKQLREITQVSPNKETSKATEPSPRAPPQPSAPATAGTPAVGELFRKHCVRCHGADGTGTRARDRLPEIPDFTAVAWQVRRSDTHLLKSILDGKGDEMPTWRGKMSKAQARGLVTFVRSFAPTAQRPAQEEQARPPPDEPAEKNGKTSFFEKLLRWLGNFHPASVHFPIALLTAAAVAELLRRVTGKVPFAAASR
jgi:mono/diheme cytochrome c family protein